MLVLSSCYLWFVIPLPLHPLALLISGKYIFIFAVLFQSWNCHWILVCYSADPLTSSGIRNFRLRGLLLGDGEQLTVSLVVSLAAERRMAPMTRKQWERERSTIRRVYDPETGRNRLSTSTVNSCFTFMAFTWMSWLIMLIVECNQLWTQSHWDSFPRAAVALLIGSLHFNHGKVCHTYFFYLLLKFPT